MLAAASTPRRTKTPTLGPVTAPEATLRSQIASAGAIPFARFMETALYGKGGYYTRDPLPIGAQGDFVTGSALSPLFAATTARLLRRLDVVLQRPADFLEMGCGSGAHLHAVAEALAGGPPRRLYGADRVRRELPKGTQRLTAPKPPADFQGLIFSYELFDALPVHRLIGREGERPGELWVALDETERFRWQSGELSDPKLVAALERARIRLRPGQIADVALEAEALYRRLARGLGRGLLVTCDYGFDTGSLFDPRARFHGTLACHRRHTVHRNPFCEIGGQDLTAHVDFGLLARVGESEGLHTLAFTRQTPWLLACGLADDLAVAAPARRRDAQVLLDGEGMGEAIRVLVQARDVDSAALFATEYREAFATSRIAAV
jgi:SAM-dependent MidA family methyltransferase